MKAHLIALFVSLLAAPVQAQVVVVPGSGGGGAATTPAGNDTEVQLNDAGAFGADANLTWDGTTLDVTGTYSLDGTQVLDIVGTTLAFGEPAAAYDAAAAENTLVGIDVAPVATGVNFIGNTLAGYKAGEAITDGFFNTVMGRRAGLRIDTQTSNTFVGNSAGSEIFSVSNTCIGDSACLSSSFGPGTGGNNVAVGASALTNIDLGSSNVAIGTSAMSSGFFDGVSNVAVGDSVVNSDNSRTVGIGSGVNLADDDTIAIGNAASTEVADGIAIGVSANVAASRGIALGGAAVASHDESIVLGFEAVSSAPGQVVFGSAGAPITELRRGREGLLGGPIPIMLFAEPTISAGLGAGAAVTTNNGPLAFRIDVGTTPGATGTIGLPAAPTGWNCFMANLTSRIANDGHEVIQLSSTTTSVSIEEQNQGNGAQVDFSDNDILSVSCFPF